MSKSKKEKPAPSTGQSGPPIDLDLSDLNPKELRVLQFLNQSGKFGDASGKRQDFTIVDIAKGCWSSKSAKQSNSWARNALRRLVRAGLVDKQDRGIYRVAMKTRKRLEKLVAEKEAKKAAETAAA